MSLNLKLCVNQTSVSDVMAVHIRTRITSAISITYHRRALKAYFAVLIFLSIIIFLWNYNLTHSRYVALSSPLTSRTVTTTTSDGSNNKTPSTSTALRTTWRQLVEPDYDCAKQYYRVCEIWIQTYMLCPFLCCRNVYHHAIFLMGVIVKLMLSFRSSCPSKSHWQASPFHPLPILSFTLWLFFFRRLLFTFFFPLFYSLQHNIWTGVVQTKMCATLNRRWPSWRMCYMTSVMGPKSYTCKDSALGFIWSAAVAFFLPQHMNNARKTFKVKSVRWATVFSRYIKALVR